MKRNNAIVIGSGPKNILVFSQILPLWNDSETMFKESFRNFINDYTIAIVDILHHYEQYHALDDFIEYAKTEVLKYNSEVIIGFSFGGSVLQHLLTSKILDNKKIILVSAPHFISPALSDRINAIIALLRQDNLEEAIALKSHYCSLKTNNEYTANLPVNNKDKMKKRLLKGFEILLTHDGRQFISNSSVKILNIYGENSLMANKEDMIETNNIISQEIRNSGIRVMIDQNAEASELMLNFINS